MGVLLTGRIRQRPDTLSTILGYADHFWRVTAITELANLSERARTAGKLWIDLLE